MEKTGLLAIIGNKMPMMDKEKKGFAGGKTEGGTDEPVIAEKEKSKEPVILHGQEYVFDAETSKKIDGLVEGGEASDAELGALVRETITKYNERGQKLTDKEPEMEVEEEEIVE